MIGLLALLTPQAHAQTAPITIRVDDPRVIAVVLKCGGKNTKRAKVDNGMVTFPEVIGTRCAVHMVRRGGLIDGPGDWTCTLDDCQMKSMRHATTKDEPGRINIVITSHHDAHGMEIKCPSGHRDRTTLTENTATFANVPSEGCELLFKGGVPAKYRPATWGTYHCQITGTTAVCIKKSAP